jgi:hypothetical protein
MRGLIGRGFVRRGGLVLFLDDGVSEKGKQVWVQVI